MKLRGGIGVAAAASVVARSGVLRYRGALPMLRRGGLATAVGLAALRSPDRTVIVRDHDTMTGRELDAAVRATAAALSQRWSAGSLIGVRGDGGIDFIVVLAAARLAGIDAVAIGPRGEPVELETVDAWEVFVREGLEREGFKTRPLRGRPQTRRGGGVLQLMSTGSTGVPTVTARGRLGVRGILQLADAERRLRLPVGPVLVLAPPDHGHGLTMVLAGLLRGRTVVLASSMRPAEQALAIARRRPSTLSGVPAQLARLLDEDDAVLDGVQLIVSGSSKLSDALRARLASRGARVLDCYGTTETGTVVIDGRPLAGVTIAVDGDQRIRITSPLSGGRRDPGDIGRIERGRLIVDGRTGAVINSGGELLAPERVAAELRAMPGVSAARVWAEPDDLLGSRLCAEVVVSDTSLDAAALTHALTQRLGRSAVPRKWLIAHS